MAKITLEVGANFTGKQSLLEVNEQIKRVGREGKDASDLAIKAFTGLAQTVDGPAKTALTGFSSVLQGFVTGGIFGIVSGLATTAFNLIQQKVEETKEKLQKFAEYLSSKFATSSNELKTQAGDVMSEWKKASDQIQDSVDALNGKTISDAKLKVHELHIDALQKITDQTTEAGRKMLEAEEKYASTITQSQAQESVQRESLKAINQKIITAKDTQEKLLTVQKQHDQKYNDFMETYNNFMNKRKTLQSELNVVEEQFKQGLINISGYQKKSGELTTELNNLETKRADILKSQKTFEEGRTTIAKNLETVEREIEKLERDKAKQEKELQVQVAASKSAIADATDSRRQATKAMNREKKAADEKAEADELAAYLEGQKSEWSKRINKQTKGNAEQYNSLMEYVNQALEDGLEDSEIEEGLRKKWQELKKKANKKLEDENDEDNSDNGKKGKGKNNVNVTIPVSQMNDLATQMEDGFNFKDWQRKNRDEQRKARDAKNNMKIDQAKMTKALKGEMPEAEAKEWMQYAKVKYTPNQIRELGKLAMNTELLSKTDQEKQLSKIEEMANALQKSLTVK